MKRNEILHVCGTVIKNESIVPVSANILENTCVAEANLPYANYYGSRPEKAQPNSIFLFTAQCYSLEEVLRFSQSVNKCYVRQLNLAASSLAFASKNAPAIRVKFLHNYDQLNELQHCLAEQGVKFSRKFPVEKEAVVRTQKCFTLQKLGDGVFLDQLEADKGYIQLPRLFDMDEFEEMVARLKNNCDCGLFDSVKTSIIFNSELVDLMRIYSEKINQNLLDCIKKTAEKIIVKKPELKSGKVPAV